MFSLLIDKLPFFAAIVNHSYFYFYISIILVTKDAVLPTGLHLLLHFSSNRYDNTAYFKSQ